MNFKVGDKIEWHKFTGRVTFVRKEGEKNFPICCCFDNIDNTKHSNKFPFGENGEPIWMQGLENFLLQKAHE